MSTKEPPHPSHYPPVVLHRAAPRPQGCASPVQQALVDGGPLRPPTAHRDGVLESARALRQQFEADWGVKLDTEPGLRIPNMLDDAVHGRFKGLYVQGEDILQSDPDTKHVAAGLAAMECVVVQDLFLNETANYAHVFLPGSTFLWILTRRERSRPS